LNEYDKPFRFQLPLLQSRLARDLRREKRR
jgi:hypothetical protein